MGRIDEIDEAMDQLNRGEACKLVLLPDPELTPKIAPTAARLAKDPNIKGAVVHR